MLSQGAASSVPTEAQELNSLFYGPLNDEWCSGLHIMCTAMKIKVEAESLIVFPEMYFFSSILFMNTEVPALWQPCWDLAS